MPNHFDLTPLLSEEQLKQLLSDSEAYEQHSWLRARARARDQAEKRHRLYTLTMLESFITTAIGKEMPKHERHTVERAAGMGDLHGF